MGVSKMSEAESFSAEGKKRKTGFRKCSKCGDTGHNAPKCVNPQYYEALARKEEMLERVFIRQRIWYGEDDTRRCNRYEEIEAHD